MPPKHREPDHTEDPRKVGTGQQLPEEQQKDAIPDDGAKKPTPAPAKSNSRRNTGQAADQPANR